MSFEHVVKVGHVGKTQFLGDFPNGETVFPKQFLSFFKFDLGDKTLGGITLGGKDDAGDLFFAQVHKSSYIRGGEVSGKVVVYEFDNPIHTGVSRWPLYITTRVRPEAHSPGGCYKDRWNQELDDNLISWALHVRLPEGLLEEGNDTLGIGVRGAGGLDKMGTDFGQVPLSSAAETAVKTVFHEFMASDGTLFMVNPWGGEVKIPRTDEKGAEIGVHRAFSPRDYVELETRMGMTGYGPNPFLLHYPEPMDVHSATVEFNGNLQLRKASRGLDKFVVHHVLRYPVCYPRKDHASGTAAECRKEV